MHFRAWEILRLSLQLQKRSERSHERWRPYSFRTNYSVNSQVFVLVAAFCSVLQGKPAVASPKEQFYEQTTSNQAFTKRNIQKLNPYPLDSRPEQKSLIMYHTLQSLNVCVWLVNTLTPSAPDRSPIICMWSPADICEQWERNFFSVQQTFVGQEHMTNL